MATSSQAHTDTLLWAFPFPPRSGTSPRQPSKLMSEPSTARLPAQDQIETLQGRVGKTSQTSRKPPSSDSPFQKPQRQPRNSGGTRGARTGHQGLGPPLLTPRRCTCRARPLCLWPWRVGLTRAVYTHPVLELPPIEMEISHCIFQQGACVGVANDSQPRCPPSIRPAMARA